MREPLDIDDDLVPLPRPLDPVAAVRANVARVAGELGALFEAAAARRPAACGRTQHWTAGYIGLPYIPGVADCAHLVERVQREVFGRELRLPADRPGWRSRDLSDAIVAAQPDYADRRARAADAQEGDAVLMVGAGRLNHLGVLVLMGAERHVLHAFVRCRQVVLHRERELERWGLAIEGYYAWR